MSEPEEEETQPPTPIQYIVMAVILSTIGAIAFCPCVVLPIITITVSLIVCPLVSFSFCFYVYKDSNKPKRPRKSTRTTHKVPRKTDDPDTDVEGQHPSRIIDSQGDKRFNNKIKPADD